jgi:hypothetical protein
MGTNRSYVRRHRRGELTHEQEMELWLGPSHRGSAFGSREELHQAWLKHRDRLMCAWAKHGKRPAGWWEFESPVAYPRDPDYAEAALYENDLLTEEEKVERIAWWREQYDRAWLPDFFHCEGPGRFFDGPVARRKHFKWAGIPQGLVKQWNSERRRRGRTIRKLEAAATSPPEPGSAA